VDHRRRFVECTVGWPGSVGDGRVWRGCSLRPKLDSLLGALPPSYLTTKVDDTSPSQQEVVPAFILADSAYPSTTRMVPTFKKTACKHCPITKKLNQKLAGIRYSVENAFATCKGRFRLLNRPLECAREDVIHALKLILAIFSLHNFLIDVDDDFHFWEDTLVSDNTNENDGEDEVHEDDDTNDGNGSATRDVLFRYMRWKRR
jgi:hypothetical protein